MSAQQAYLTIVYRITHPSQPKALLEQAEWSAASHSHAIHDRDRLEGQRDILLEALREVAEWDAIGAFPRVHAVIAKVTGEAA